PTCSRPAASAPPAGPPSCSIATRSGPLTSGSETGASPDMAFFDIYLLEALINGVLLGGVFALLSLGLNLIFGVIDVVWICYAELIMLGMYGMYFVYSVYHAPFAVAAVTCIAGVAVLGVILHVLVIAPLLGAAPINQLLATGGVLFFLQSAATVMFGIEFKNLGLRLPVLEAAQGHSRNAARPEAP